MNIGIGAGDCDPAYDEVEYFCPECNSIMEEGWVNWKCTKCDFVDVGDEPNRAHEHE